MDGNRTPKSKRKSITEKNIITLDNIRIKHLCDFLSCLVISSLVLLKIFKFIVIASVVIFRPVYIIICKKIMFLLISREFDLQQLIVV